MWATCYLNGVSSSLQCIGQTLVQWCGALLRFVRHLETCLKCCVACHLLMMPYTAP